MTDIERRQIADFCAELRGSIKCKRPGRSERAIVRIVDKIDQVTGIVTAEKSE